MDHSATTLVSIMHANNEIGTIEPIPELVAISHQAGAAFHETTRLKNMAV